MEIKDSTKGFGNEDARLRRRRSSLYIILLKDLDNVSQP